MLVHRTGSTNPVIHIINTSGKFNAKQSECNKVSQTYAEVLTWNPFLLGRVLWNLFKDDFGVFYLDLKNVYGLKKLNSVKLFKKYFKKEEKKKSFCEMKAFFIK